MKNLTPPADAKFVVRMKLHGNTAVNGKHPVEMFMESFFQEEKEARIFFDIMDKVWATRKNSGLDCFELMPVTDIEKANAQLISASKEMYEALKTALAIFGNGYEPKEGAEPTMGSRAYLKMKQALNKAEGK